VLTAGLGAALGAYAWRWIGSLQIQARGLPAAAGRAEPRRPAPPPAGSPPAGRTLADPNAEPIARASS
jgi:hypothetical protein